MDQEEEKRVKGHLPPPPCTCRKDDGQEEHGSAWTALGGGQLASEGRELRAGRRARVRY